MGSGDFNPPDNNFKNLVRAVANSIKLKMGAALQTFHGERHTPALGFWGTSEQWLTVNDIYTDENDVFSMARTEHQRPFNRSPMPFFMIENRYENEGSPAADAPWCARKPTRRCCRAPPATYWATSRCGISQPLDGMLANRH